MKCFLVPVTRFKALQNFLSKDFKAVKALKQASIIHQKTTEGSSVNHQKSRFFA